MDQRSICLYLNTKRLSAQAIDDELAQVFDANVIAYSTMTFYLRQSQWRAKNEEQHSDRPPDVIDNAILRCLHQNAFASGVNWQSQLLFQLQWFGGAWLGPWDLLSSICTGSLTS
jgi:hypothetical protein